MFTFIARRVLWLIPVSLGVILIINIVMSFVPGDAARVMLGEQATEAQVQALRTRLGLDRPVYVQFARYVLNALQGDLGQSFRTRRSVVEELMDTVPNTIQLGVLALVVTTLVGIPTGVMAAVNRSGWFDGASLVFTLILLSMPVFWSGLLLLYYFAYVWPMFPMGGYGSAVHFVLPVITLSAPSWATVTRMTRTSMLEILEEDYIRTARAKGLPERVVIYKHALKSALIPVITVLGLQMGTMLGGAVLTETVFAWPGVGRLLVRSIRARDLLLLQGGVAFLAVGFVLVNLLVDMFYALVDPRIRY